MRKEKKKFFRLAFLLIGFIFLFPYSLQAWKTITHVHFVLICRQDALDDGKLVIYEMDYENGRIRVDAQGKPVEIGRYEVDPMILDAIKQYPDHLKAGAVGTDVLPDLLTAQTIVHPDNSSLGKTISDNWLQLIWTEARKIYKPQTIAFAAGYLSHGAGDLFGHSFINYYSGGPFELGKNALKHMVLESYIDKRTPLNDPNFFRLSIKGIEDFLYKNLVAHPYIWSQPDDIQTSSFMNLSPPRFFLFLREFWSKKQSDLSKELSQKEKEYKAAINALLKEAGSSAPPLCNILTVQAAALESEWMAIKTSYLALITYLKEWIKDIDQGLKAWPEFGRKIAEFALFCREPDKEKAEGAAQDFMNKYGYSMIGLPDAVGQSQAAYKELWELIPKQIRDLIDLFSTDPILFLIEKAWGISWDYLKNPEVHFDVIMNNPPGAKTTLQNFNRDVLKINDPGYSTNETYNWMNIPAMVNSVTMTKLTWLTENGLRQLLRDLEEKGYTSNTFEPLIKIGDNPLPPIIGFIRSLDQSNQWCEGNRLIFVYDPCVYRKLFLKQLGDNIPGCLGECDTPPDGSVIKNPLSFPLAAGFKHFDVAVDKQGRVWQWGKAYLLTQPGGKQIFAELAGPTIKEQLTEVVQATVSRHPNNWVFVLKKDGTVFGWGAGSHASFGLWKTKDVMEPLPVPNLQSIVQLAAGTYHGLALRSNGQVWAWGDNTRGQIGWGKKEHPARPTRVPGLSKVKFIAAGDYSSYAVTTDGLLWSWGAELGEAGHDLKNDRYRPERMANLTEVKMVAASSAHILVLKEDGTVWAWGQNSEGEVGNGELRTFQRQPVEVKGLKDITFVAASNFTSVALKKDGTVWVWGHHHLEGPLSPSGKKYFSELPVQVKGIPKIVALSCGQDHILVLDSEGFIWGWGSEQPIPKKMEGLKLF